MRFSLLLFNPRSPEGLKSLGLKPGGRPSDSTFQGFYAQKVLIACDKTVEMSGISQQFSFYPDCYLFYRDTEGLGETCSSWSIRTPERCLWLKY